MTREQYEKVKKLIDNIHALRGWLENMDSLQHGFDLGKGGGLLLRGRKSSGFLFIDSESPLPIRDAFTDLIFGRRKELLAELESCIHEIYWALKSENKE